MARQFNACKSKILTYFYEAEKINDDICAMNSTIQALCVDNNRQHTRTPYALANNDDYRMKDNGK